MFSSSAAADEAQAMINAVGGRIRGVATNAVQAPPIDLLEQLPRLKIMASSGIGTDALNIDYARERGIRITNTPNVLTDDVADAAVMLMLATSRQLVLADRNARAGRWLEGLSMSHRVSGKRLGILVNVGCGSAVDETALIEALSRGRIRGAGLDVLADEPNVPDALYRLDNVVLSPHYASFTVETRLAMGQLVVDNLRAHFDGRPLLTPVASRRYFLLLGTSEFVDRSCMFGCNCAFEPI